MLELIFVIVILGIVSSIGAEIIVNVYEQYIVQRAQHRASLKTELATLQIANRLHYAIPGTIYRIKNDGTLESIESSFASGTGDDYVGLQWVGYDADSFEAISSNATPREPGWSGFCDLDASSEDSIKTLGSKLALTDDIIANLSSGTKGLSDAALYFPYQDTEHNISGRTGDDVIDLDNNTSRIAEQYKLAWTSYALVVENEDLNLYYNFPPSPKASYTNTPKELLLKNISTFKFKGAATGIRFKICREEQIGDADFNITACKEKVAF